MKVGVLQFPGSNCDQDGLFALRNDLGMETEYLWHGQHDLDRCDAIFVPGGFTYGDYLRCGAVAARSPIMLDVIEFAKRGGPVIGICNGFQILCEAGLLPGALMRNVAQKFLCQNVHLRAENRISAYTRGVDRILSIPIAHGEGRYLCDEDTLKQIEGEGQVAFRYVGPNGEEAPEWNPNGSLNAIAGVLNGRGNVLGMMPHPERATNSTLGGVDGIEILRGLALVNA